MWSPGPGTVASLNVYHPQAGRESQLERSEWLQGHVNGAQELLFWCLRMVGKGAVCQQDPLSWRQGSVLGPGLVYPSLHRGPAAPLEEEDAGGSAFPM